MLLADAAPSGAGLAIVGVIFLVFIAVCLGVVVLLVRLFLKRRKGQGPPPAPPVPPAETDVPTD